MVRAVTGSARRGFGLLDLLVIVALVALFVWVVREDGARRRAGGTSPAAAQSVTHSS
jgi:bacteriorhodopsin